MGCDVPGSIKKEGFPENWKRNRENVAAVGRRPALMQ
jgi:hypothetical protein